MINGLKKEQSKNDLSIIKARISSLMRSKMWDNIDYPFPNFNGVAV